MKTLVKFSNQILVNENIYNGGSPELKNKFLNLGIEWVSNEKSELKTHFFCVERTGIEPVIPP